LRNNDRGSRRIPAPDYQSAGQISTPPVRFSTGRMTAIGISQGFSKTPRRRSEGRLKRGPLGYPNGTEGVRLEHLAGTPGTA